MNEQIKITENEREFMTPHEIYKSLCKKYDAKFYKEFQFLAESKINSIIRPAYKHFKIYTIDCINRVNEKEGLTKIQEIDITDSDVVTSIDKRFQYDFLRLARILDFYDGFKPIESN